jgi:hypothetical protein
MLHPASVSAVALSSIHPERSLKSPIALSLSVGGSASLTGQVEAHIIPRVEFGVTLLLGAAQASIYLEVDGYGVLDMHLAGSIAASTSTPIPIGTTTSTASTSTNASTNTSTCVSGATTSTDTSAGESTSAGTSTSTSDYSTTTSTAEASASITTSTCANPVAVDTAKAQLGHTSYSGASSKRDGSSFIYEGCVGLDVGVSVNAGAQGNLLNLWSGDISWEIYSQKWDIFEVSCFLTYFSDGLLQFATQKCFGTPARRRSESKLNGARFDLRSNQLTCPSVLNQISLI